MFTLVSYNIQLNGLDSSAHQWVERKHAVLQLLNRGDIFGLQEVSHTQFLDIQQNLSDYECIGYNTVSGKPLQVQASNLEEGLMIGWKKDKFKLEQDYGLTWFSETPTLPSKGWGCQFPKGLLHISLENNGSGDISLENNGSGDISLETNGKIIHILNSHFPHEGNHSNPRIHASNMEIQILKELKEPWISLGDRNFHFPGDQEAYDMYKRENIIDSKTISQYVHGCNSTFLGYEDHPRCKVILNGYVENPEYLDVIFASSDLKPSIWVSHPGHYDDNGYVAFDLHSTSRKFGSDHCAILVTYTY